MDPTRLSVAAGGGHEHQDRAKKVQEAQDMYQMVLKNVESSNSSKIPPFEFLELIGKGGFGKVFKCRDRRTGELVAIKIILIDAIDYSNTLESPAADREDSIRDFRKEVATLRELKDKRAPNVLGLHDAFDLGDQLWIVSDYCTGGSLRTLLRAWEENGKARGLPEELIVAIARELAVAVEGLQSLGMIHRDIKGANVYVTEDGEIQLGDFGITGTLNHPTAKRNTVIGTPHFLPKEILHKLGRADRTDKGYGYEVDIWAYGCTIYEMATGHAPYAHLEGSQVVNQANDLAPPRLENDKYSPELHNLIAICLEEEPDRRATIEDVLQHPFIVDSSVRCPTRNLVRLIEKYKIWEHGGGSRASLWIPAPVDQAMRDPRILDQEAKDDDLDYWSFSTSDGYDMKFALMSNSEGLSHAQDQNILCPAPAPPATKSKDLSIAERIKREHIELSASRGEKLLARLYDPSDETGYETRPTEDVEAASTSDLPLRDSYGDAPTRESMIEIDLDEATGDGSSTSALSAIDEMTVKPVGRRAFEDEEESFEYPLRDDGEKRATMAWTFPTSVPAASDAKRGTMDWTFQTAEQVRPIENDYSMASPNPDFSGELAPGFRPALLRTSTEPLGHFRDYSHDMTPDAGLAERSSVTSMIDLDLGLAEQYHQRLANPAAIARPSTANSACGSTMTDMTSGNPFDLEDDPVQNELDRNRFSYHKQWQSDGGEVKRQSHKTMHMHARGSSLSSTNSEVDRHDSSATESTGLTPIALHQAPMGFGYDLESSILTDEGNPWPGFATFDTFEQNNVSFSSINDVPDTGAGGFEIEGTLHTNDYSSRSRETSNEPPGLEVAFPEIVPPNLEALAEDASPHTLGNELSRQLDALAMSLNSVSDALRQAAQLEDYDGDDMSSDVESGFESAKEGTGDEDPGETVTSRRPKPRKLEV